MSEDIKYFTTEEQTVLPLVSLATACVYCSPVIFIDSEFGVFFLVRMHIREGGEGKIWLA